MQASPEAEASCVAGPSPREAGLGRKRKPPFGRPPSGAELALWLPSANADEMCLVGGDQLGAGRGVQWIFDGFIPKPRRDRLPLVGSCLKAMRLAAMPAAELQETGRIPPNAHHSMPEDGCRPCSGSTRRKWARHAGDARMKDGDLRVGPSTQGRKDATRLGQMVEVAGAAMIGRPRATGPASRALPRTRCPRRRGRGRPKT